MRVRAVAAAGAVAFVLSACGSGDVPPEDWARDVCVAVKPWSTQIDASVNQARQQITDAADPTKAKAELVAVFSGAQQASADAAGRVRKAGIPDADNGEQVATQFTKALDAARENFGRAADGVQALPTTDRGKFYEGVVKVGEQLSKDNNASSAQLSAATSKDLEKAFKDVPECR
jgi:hypothetical protein